MVLIPEVHQAIQPYGDVPILAAGGIVTNWQGETVNEGGQVIAAGDPEVHAAAIKLLNN